MSILIFLAVLFVLVLVHELGHFMVAKWTGMRVDEFGIGFPPKLFGIKKGETEYTFNLFPIGGFVKIFGENYDDTPVTESNKNTPIIHKEGSFLSKSKWSQSAVLVAGITMNILFAWFLVAIAFGMGVETSVTPEKASESAKLIITSVMPESPAAKATIATGSVIKSVQSGEDTLTTLTPTSFSAFIETHPDAPLTIVYTQKGEPRVVQITSQKGVIADKPEQHAIGVALSQVDTVHRTIIQSIKDSAIYIMYGLRDITIGITSLLYDTFMFKADLSQVAGPIGIVGLVGEASAYGITALLMFTAFISLNLAVINILPIPALDGGRLVFVVIEAVKGTPITPRIAATINTVGFLFLITLMIAVTWHDIARLI
jgi:regulator of sigma E protease